MSLCGFLVPIQSPEIAQIFAIHDGWGWAPSPAFVSLLGLSPPSLEVSFSLFTSCKEINQHSFSQVKKTPRPISKVSCWQRRECRLIHARQSISHKTKVELLPPFPQHVVWRFETIKLSLLICVPLLNLTILRVRRSMLLQVLRIHNGCFVHTFHVSNHEMFSNLVHVPQGKKRFSRLRKGSECDKNL